MAARVNNPTPIGITYIGNARLWMDGWAASAETTIAANVSPPHAIAVARWLDGRVIRIVGAKWPASRKEVQTDPGLLESTSKKWYALLPLTISYDNNVLHPFAVF